MRIDGEHGEVERLIALGKLQQLVAREREQLLVFEAPPDPVIRWDKLVFESVIIIEDPVISMFFVVQIATAE